MSEHKHDVFLSFGTPDEEAATQLNDRLVGAGLSVFFYPVTTDPGDPVSETIQEAIGKSCVAVICISDESFERPWITTEAAFIKIAEKLKIVPVQVGPWTPGNFPPAIKSADLSAIDLSKVETFEYHLDRLMHVIHTSIKRKMEPLPAVLFAMRPDELALGLERSEKLLALCEHLGMKDAGDRLLHRYHAEPQEYRPFLADKPLVHTIHTAIRLANVERIRLNRLPLCLQWLNPNIFGEIPESMDAKERREAQDRKDAARDLWQHASSRLIVIDSLSMCHPEVQKRIDKLPTYDPFKSVLIWIPPYTQLTAELEEKVEKAMKDADAVDDYFRNWRNDRQRVKWESPLRRCAFFMETETSLWYWIYLMSQKLGEPEPNPPRVDRVKATYPTKFSLEQSYP